jgi:phage terminase large subunit-like protein
MGWLSMNGPCQELERLLLLKKLNHGGNPILRWMADNVSVKVNPTGGGKSPNKASSQGKIDGIVGTLLALDRKLRMPEIIGSGYEANDAEIMVF